MGGRISWAQDEYKNEKDVQKKADLKDQSFHHYMAYLLIRQNIKVYIQAWGHSILWRMISVQNKLIVQLIFCQIINMTVKTNKVDVVNLQWDVRTLMTKTKKRTTKKVDLNSLLYQTAIAVERQRPNCPDKEMGY